MNAENHCQLATSSIRLTSRMAADDWDPTATFPYCPWARCRGCSASSSPDLPTCRLGSVSGRTRGRPQCLRPWSFFADLVGDSWTPEVSYLHCEPYGTTSTWTRGVGGIPATTRSERALREDRVNERWSSKMEASATVRSLQR